MSWRKLPIFLLVIFLVLLFIPQKVIAAASISMQNGPTQIGINDEYTVDVQVSISVADNTAYYLRGVFYQPGTSNYCGYTWNGNDWFKGPFSNNGDQRNFYKISITNHQWSGQLKAKIDPDDSGCATSGTYAFKIERFTDNSNSGTFDAQTEQTVIVVIPTPTPTPLPTNTPFPPTPTFTPTPTVKPTSKPTTTSTPKPFNTPTPNIINPALTTDVSSLDAVLGTMSAENLVNNTPAPKSKELVAHVSEKKSFPIFIIFMLAGFCLLATCAILIFLKTDKGQELWEKFS